MNSYQSTFLESLIELDIEHKKHLFSDINELVDRLYKLKLLLENNQSKEALLLVEQLVPYGESLVRNF